MYKGTWQLDNIPRQATITAASDFTDLDNPSISFSNPGGFTMDVWIEPNPVGDHLCVRKGISNTGKYTWSLTDAERDELRNYCAGTECTVRLGLYTYIGKTTYSDYKDKKFTIKESAATKPAVSISTSLNNGSLPSVFDGLYIQGKSKVGVTLSAEGKYGAEIKSYSATLDGKNYNTNEFTSDVIRGSGSMEIVGYAKDSRKFTGSAKQAINVLAYSKPLVIPVGSETAIQCYRSDGNGKRTGNSTSVWIKAKRVYHDVSGKNGCALQWRMKRITEVWDDDRHLWVDLLPRESASDEYNALLQGVVFDLKESYAVQIRAVDDIGEEDPKTFEIPTRDVALHLGKGGKNVSIGSYCDYSEERTFHSEWKAIFDEEMHTKGHARFDSGLTVDGDDTVPVSLKDTGWIDLGLSESVQAANSNFGRIGSGCAYRVINGNHVYVAFNCSCAYAGTYIQVNLNLIPEQYRPARNVYMIVPTNGKRIARVIAKNDGTVLLEYVQLVPSDAETTEATVNWVDGYLDYWL